MAISPCAAGLCSFDWDRSDIAAVEVVLRNGSLNGHQYTREQIQATKDRGTFWINYRKFIRKNTWPLHVLQQNPRGFINDWPRKICSKKNYALATPAFAAVAARQEALL